MVDLNDDDLVPSLVDPVPHSVLPAPGTPQAAERFSQRRTHDPWSVEQRTGDELPRSKGRGRRQCLAQGASGSGRET